MPFRRTTWAHVGHKADGVRNPRIHAGHEHPVDDAQAVKIGNADHTQAASRDCFAAELVAFTQKTFGADQLLAAKQRHRPFDSIDTLANCFDGAQLDYGNVV